MSMADPGWTPGTRPRPAAVVALTHPFAVGAAAVAAAGYLAIVDPNRPGHYPTCPLLLLTGYYCPGCGGLRAVHDLIHGDFAAALSSNLLVVLAVPVVIALWLDWTRNRLSGRASRVRIPGGLAWSLLVVLLAFWGLRNLPEMSWLAP
jgi:hypothetical protein